MAKRKIDIDNEFEDFEGEVVAPAAKKKAKKIGHNSGIVDSDQLLSIVQRVENLLDQKADIQADIRDVFYEAKGNGYNPKVIRAVIKERAADRAKLDEFNYELDVYRRALGLTGEDDK